MKAFEADKVSKRFGETIALDNVTFSADCGEIHGLIGENGAGKSTLMKVLSGVHRPDSGTITILDKKVVIHNPWEGVQNQVVVVHQELSLVPDLTVAENLYLPHQPAGGIGIVSKKKVETSAQQHLESLGITDINPGKQVRELSLRDRQLVEISKALHRKAQILVLDEPTSALGLKDVEWLFNLVKKLSQQGVSVVYISHRMGEIRGICQRLTVLRNGNNVGTYRTSDVNDDEVVNLMIGRSIDVVFPPKPKPNAHPQPSVVLKDVHTRGGLRGVDLTLNRGEVLGIAALQGHGQEQLFECLFGLVPITKGTMSVNGKPVHFRSPRAAIHLGGMYTIGLIPEDRKRDGLIVEMPVRENTSLPTLKKITRLGWVRRKKEMAEIGRVFKELNIDLQKTNAVAAALSGGNQQKLVMAKWLLAECQIMLMFDPTRGVDVGTKAEIYKLIRKMADEGKSILLYSSEISEVLGLADRIIVQYNGRVFCEFPGQGTSEQEVLSAMLGIGKNMSPETQAREGRIS
jgi:ribose transport system ATP-binding protein